MVDSQKKIYFFPEIDRYRSRDYRDKYKESPKRVNNNLFVFLIIEKNRDFKNYKSSRRYQRSRSKSYEKNSYRSKNDKSYTAKISKENEEVIKNISKSINNETKSSCDQLQSENKDSFSADSLFINSLYSIIFIDDEERDLFPIDKDHYPESISIKSYK